MTHTGPETEHERERVFGAMLLSDLTLPFSRVPLTIVRPLVPGANIGAVDGCGRGLSSDFLGGPGRPWWEELQRTPIGPSQGGGSGLVGPTWSPCVEKGRGLEQLRP